MSLHESVTYVYRLWRLYLIRPFFARPQFGRTAELDALNVRPKGEGQGWPESKKGRKKRHPQEPALRVRSLTWENPFAINSLRFTPLRQKLLSTDFPCTRSPGSEGEVKK